MDEPELNKDVADYIRRKWEAARKQSIENPHYQSLVNDQNRLVGLPKPNWPRDSIYNPGLYDV
jgi:hypothetical protein